MRELFRWPWSISVVWLALPVVGAIIAATLEPIPPHDYWWHLTVGRWIASTGGLPDSNLFLYTLAVDEPFTNQPWLGQLTMWLTYDLGGHSGMVWLRNVLLAAAMGLLVWTGLRRSADPRATGALGLLTAVLAYPVLTARTRMFAFLPFAAVLWSALGVADGRLNRRWLLVPPVATAVWANVHGSFILGPLIVCGIATGLVFEALLQERQVDRETAVWWGGAGLLTIAAGAVGPHGPGAYAYVIQLALESPVSSSVTEWLPPSLERGIGVVFLIAVTTTIAVLVRNRAHVRLFEVFIFAGTLYLSASAVRSMFWWAAVLLVVVAPHLARMLPTPSEEETSVRAGVLHAAVIAILAVLVMGVQPGIGRGVIGQAAGAGLARTDGPGAWILNHENADASLQKVLADHRERVFHDQALGGMVEFYLSGQDETQVAFVDQRMEFVPESVWDQYFLISSGRRWREAVDAYGIDTMLLSHESQWPLVQELTAAEDWSLAYVDQSHVLFYRDSFDGTQDPAKE